MNGDYNLTTFNDIDSKTSGRWSREEHEKFIEGMKIIPPLFFININLVYSDEFIWKRLEKGRKSYRN